MDTANILVNVFAWLFIFCGLVLLYQGHMSGEYSKNKEYAIGGVVAVVFIGLMAWYIYRAVKSGGSGSDTVEKFSYDKGNYLVTNLPRGKCYV